MSTWARRRGADAGHDQARRHALAADVGDDQADVVVGQGDEVVEVAAQRRSRGRRRWRSRRPAAAAASAGSSAAARRAASCTCFSSASASIASASSRAFSIAAAACAATAFSRSICNWREVPLLVGVHAQHADRLALVPHPHRQHRTIPSRADSCGYCTRGSVAMFRTYSNPLRGQRDAGRSPPRSAGSAPCSDTRSRGCRPP